MYPIFMLFINTEAKSSVTTCSHHEPLSTHQNSALTCLLKFQKGDAHLYP